MSLGVIEKRIRGESVMITLFIIIIIIIITTFTFRTSIKNVSLFVLCCIVNVGYLSLYEYGVFNSHNR